jgi:hypothetical protein
MLLPAPQPACADYGFDTDYLNSQKEKLNESISNVICLTYLMCPVSKNKTCCCFQTFKDLLAFLLLPFLIGSANVEAFLFLPNLLS